MSSTFLVFKQPQWTKTLNLPEGKAQVCDRDSANWMLFPTRNWELVTRRGMAHEQSFLGRVGGAVVSSQGGDARGWMQRSWGMGGASSCTCWSVSGSVLTALALWHDLGCGFGSVHPTPDSSAFRRAVSDLKSFQYVSCLLKLVYWLSIAAKTNNPKT